MYNSSEADVLFKRLDLELMENIDSQYFSEPREFRSLNEVLEILGQKVDQINKTVGDASKDLLTVLKDRNPAYSKLLNQRKIVEEVIEDVVKFQHGGLNNSVDTMSEVVREYTRGRDDIQGLRKSLFETQAVLTAKKVGQVPLKELWQKKVELQESLRMVKDLESLKSAPHRIQRLIQQKRYLTAVNTLNKAITVMFGEDLVSVGGLSHLRQQLMDMKETVLETCVAELKSAVVAAGTEQLMKDYDSQSDSEDEETADNKSTSARSYVTSSHINDEVRTIVSQSAAGGGGGDKAAYLTGAAGIRASLTSGLDAWPVDLRDLDESLESSLADPSAAGSLYIRLLVRAIGVLEAEADVERMVLDGVVERFKESSLRHVRENAAAKLAKELAHFSQDRSEDDDELSVHTRLFTSFIGCLLDSTLLALRRMLYLMKLLYVSKAMSAGEGGGYSGTAHIDVDKYFKEQSKRQVLSVWMGMEDLVVLQMLSHLVEPDVQDITDSGTGRLEGLVSKYGSQGREGFMLLEKGDDGAGDGEVELIFTPTARHAAPIFRRVVVYSQLVGRIMKENNLEDARQALLTQRASAAPKEKEGSNKPATTSGSILDVVQVFLENELIPVIQSTVNAGMREIQLNSAHFSVVRAAGDSAADANKRRAAQDVVPLCPAAELCCTASKPLFSYWLQLHQHRSMVSTVLDRLIRGFASAAREELENLTYNCLSVTQDNMHASLVQATKLDPLYRAYRAKIFGPNKYSVDDLFALPGASADSSKSLARRSFMPSGASAANNGNIAGSPQRRSVLRGSNAHLAAGWESTDIEDAKGRNALEVTVWEQLEYWDVGNHNYPITSQKIVKDFLAVGTIASISYACDWLIKKLSGFSAIAARKISSSTQISSAAPAPSPAVTGRKTIGGGGSLSGLSSTNGNSTTGMGGGGAGIGMGVAGSRASTVVAYKQSQKAELHEQKMLLITTVVAGTKELSKIAEEGMALLRGELQLICFYFLHRLSHVVYSPPSSAQLDSMGGKRKSFSTSSPLTMGRDFNNKGNSSPTQRSIQQSAGQGQGQGQGAGQGQGVSAEEGLAEEEAILSAFNDHLRSYLQAVMSSTSSDALAALLSPLCSVIPRILTHCAMHMVSEIDKANSDDSAEDHFSPTASADHYLKTHLLRMVVSVQQSFALQIQSYGVANETKRRLLDLLTDGFERSRRFITMFGMPASELKAYLKSNSNDYSKEEVEILWMKSIERDVTFVQLWKELETIPRTGPRASAALQFAR